MSQESGGKQLTHDAPSFSLELTDLIRQKAVLSLNECILRMPYDAKAAYLEAMRLCPQLMNTESDPIRFLRSENFDVNAAASRLISYWTTRKEIFGDRAFLPLVDLTGTGALSTDDIHAFTSGSIVLLPKDLQGHSVLFVDRKREIAALNTMESVLRRIFFVCAILAENPISQTDGYVCLVRVSGFNDTGPHFYVQQSSELIKRSLPVRIKAIHMVYRAPNRMSFIQSIIPFLLQRVGSFFFRFMVVHVCNSEQEAGRELSLHGLLQEALPEAFGGGWTYHAEFVNFLRDHGLTTDRPLLHLSSVQPIDLLQEAAALMDRASTEVVGDIATRQPIEDFMAKESTGIQERGKAKLDEALQLLPDYEKAAYLEALKRVPYLVEKESNPLRFLRFERYNAWAAARRLAIYWKNRVEVFGSRAFLPLTISGDGALDQDAIAIFQTGYFFFLSNDSSGRTVLCYDMSKRVHHSLTIRKQISFYIFSIITENDKSQMDGYVAIVITGRPGFVSNRFDGNMTECINLVQDSFPTKPINTHVIYCPSEKRSFFEQILPVLLSVMGRFLRSNPAIFHVGESPSNLVEKLKSHGLAPVGLPGSSQAEGESFSRWLAERRLYENTNYGTKLAPVPKSAPQRGSVHSSVNMDYMTEIKKALNTFPSDEIRACMEAIEKAPQLVEKESQPQRFLQVEDFDVVAAARRFATYWSIRKLVFGDRAMLPLDQTGFGALERKDVVVLGTAYLSQLPCDLKGRTVVCCDGTRLQRSSRLTRLRCAFYMWSIISENEVSQKDGYVVLYMLTEPSFDRANKESFELAMRAIPARLHSFHLLGCLKDKIEDKAALHETMNETIEILSECVEGRSVQHVATSRDDLAKDLEGYGIHRDDLPKSLGGNWGFQRFVQWQELRVRYEWDLPIGSGTKTAADRFRVPNITIPSNPTEEERVERKRRMNVIHSRRKRERERIEIEGLNDQCIELEDSRNRLRMEGVRLEGLLNKAVDLVNSSKLR